METIQKSWGAGKVSTTQASAFTAKTDTPVNAGEGADLDKVE